MIRSSNFSLPLLSAKASETNSKSFSTHAVKILRRRTGKEERVNQWETLTELWQIEKQESKVAGKSQRWWRLRKKEGRKRKMKKEREKLGKKKLGGPPIRVLSQSLWKVQGRVGFRWPSSCALLELDRVCWVADTQFIYRNKEKDTFTTYFCVRNKPEGKKDKKKKIKCFLWCECGSLYVCCACVYYMCVKGRAKWAGFEFRPDSLSITIRLNHVTRSSSVKAPLRSRWLIPSGRGNPVKEVTFGKKKYISLFKKDVIRITSSQRFLPSVQNWR